MPVRLESVYLANVLLYINAVETIMAFPFVSRNCYEATLTLKMNPVAFSKSPGQILKLFPNINTMVVDELSSFDERDELPDTVTALVVGFLHFEGLSEKQLRFADRVVEIQGFNSTDKHPTDFSIFPNLKRLTLAFDLEKLVLPTHKLKRLTVRWERTSTGLNFLFPSEWAEHTIVTYRLPEVFSEAKTMTLPPNVHVFCSEIDEGVAPEDFLLWKSPGEITLSDGFGADDLCAFN